MTKETRNNLLGMAVYFAASVAFGGAVGAVLLAVHEDNDRCHYYGGQWNKGDLARGLMAVMAGMAARWAVETYLL